MQLNLLQEDLFSTAVEAAPKLPKKSKPTAAKIAVAMPAKAEPLLVEEMESAPAHPTVAAEPAPVPAAPEPAALAAHDAEESELEQLAEKAPNAFKTISEVADFLGLPQHVLRFWESRFSQIKPLKLRGGRRYYRPDDIEVLSTIKHLLYKQGYTINGAKKAFSQGKNILIQNVHMQEDVTQTEKELSSKTVTEKQKIQLAAIRQELFALRETLRPYTQQGA